MKGSTLLCPVLLFALAWTGTAWGHDARPLSIVLFEQPNRVYRVRVQAPPSLDPVNQPGIEWPEACASPESDAGGLVRCAEPIEGQTLGIVYPLFNPSLSTVARFVPLEGAARTAILGPDIDRWTVPRAPTRYEVARDYLKMGIAHIWQGVDHLLFVLGLLLLARTGRRILLVITGFTLAHSITLSLSALGVVRLAPEPTEAAIALSILFLAAELVREDSERLASRYPLLVSASFGLLHGLGFAAALGEIGIPPHEVVTSLLFFNLGVEVGQVLFILPFVGAAALWTRMGWPALSHVPLRPGAAYAIGGLAAFWFIQRLAAF